MAEIADSILDTTKKLVGVDPENTDFDLDLTTHINTVFFELQQLGVGPTEGFDIEDNTKTWSEFIGSESIRAVKSLMVAKVRLLFDPPPTGPATEAVERQISRLEWRLNIHMEEVRNKSDNLQLPLF